MRRFWPLLAFLLTAFAIAGLVGVLRRESLSPTPGGVVEDFLGHVVSGGFEEATPLLAERGGATPATLRRWKENIEAGLGKVRRVRGETDWISGEQAEATGVLVAERRERRLRFALEREEGHWRITQLDEFWGRPESAAYSPGPLTP